MVNVVEYETFSCKWYELDEYLETRTKLGYKLHSFAVANQGFTEYAYVIMQKA